MGLRLLNVMRGEAEGLEVVVFDLHRALSRDGAVMHARFTVVFFREASALWPLLYQEADLSSSTLSMTRPSDSRRTGEPWR